MHAIGERQDTIPWSVWWGLTVLNMLTIRQLNTEVSCCKASLRFCICACSATTFTISAAESSSTLSAASCRPYTPAIHQCKPCHQTRFVIVSYILMWTSRKHLKCCVIRKKQPACLPHQQNQTSAYGKTIQAARQIICRHALTYLCIRNAHLLLLCHAIVTTE